MPQSKFGLMGFDLVPAHFLARLTGEAIQVHSRVTLLYHRQKLDKIFGKSTFLQHNDVDQKGTFGGSYQSSRSKEG